MIRFTLGGTAERGAWWNDARNLAGNIGPLESMRALIHRLAYLATFILAVAAAFAFEEILAAWAAAHGYDGLIRAGVRYMVDAGLDGIVLAGFLFFLGASLAFLIDDLFRRHEKRGAADARCLLCWNPEMSVRIEASYNCNYCGVWSQHSIQVVCIVFDKPINTPYLLAGSNIHGIKIRERVSSDRVMFLDVAGWEKEARLSLWIRAGRTLPMPEKRLFPTGWRDAYYVPEMDGIEFASGRDMQFGRRVRRAYNGTMSRLRRRPPSAAS